MKKFIFIIAVGLASVYLLAGSNNHGAQWQQWFTQNANQVASCALSPGQQQALQAKAAQLEQQLAKAATKIQQLQTAAHTAIEQTKADELTTEAKLKNPPQLAVQNLPQAEQTHAQNVAPQVTHVEPAAQVNQVAQINAQPVMTNTQRRSQLTKLSEAMMLKAAGY
jgi:outer membrane murein-binding lipoprotein Lpp